MAEILRAVKPFYTEQPGCLQVAVGEGFTLVKKVNDNWLYVTSTASNKSGYVPPSCFELAKTPKSLRSPSRQSPTLPDFAPNTACVAKFTFRADRDDQLSFKLGDVLTLICADRGGWYHARDKTGKEGKIPGNYLNPVTASPGGSQNPGQIFGNAQTSNVSTNQPLIQTSSSIVAAGSIKRRGPPPQPPNSRPMSWSPSTSMVAPPISDPLSAHETPSVPTQLPSSVNVKPEETQSQPAVKSEQEPKVQPAPLQTANVEVAPLIQTVRDKTGISYKQSLKAVLCVMDHLMNTLPKDMVDRIMLSYTDVGEDDTPSHHPTGGESSGGSSGDERRLEIIFSELKAHAEDTQQQNWAIYDDAPVLLEYLGELQQLLQDASAPICRKSIRQDRYDNTDALLNYYQRDPRIKVRMELLKTYGSIGLLDKAVFSRALLTNLPVELARTITEAREVDEYLYYTLVFCSMLYASGERIPLQIYEHWNTALLHKLLSLCVVEDDVPLTSHVADAAIATLLAFNLHLDPADPLSAGPTGNYVMETLTSSDGTMHAAFSERLLLLVNRNVDPVLLPATEDDNSPPQRNSLLKMLQDLFSRKETAQIFFTNDLKVLLEISLRELRNLTPLDKVRVEWLRMLRGLLLNTDYTEHRYLQTELEEPVRDIATAASSEFASEEETEIAMKILEIFRMMG